MYVSEILLCTPRPFHSFLRLPFCCGGHAHPTTLEPIVPHPIAPDPTAPHLAGILEQSRHGLTGLERRGREHGGKRQQQPSRRDWHHLPAPGTVPGTGTAPPAAPYQRDDSLRDRPEPRARARTREPRGNKERKKVVEKSKLGKKNNNNNKSTTSRERKRGARMTQAAGLVCRPRTDTRDKVKYVACHVAPEVKKVKIR